MRSSTGASTLRRAMDTRRSFGVGKSRPSARLCSVSYTAVLGIYLGHRRDHLSSSGQKKELSGLGMCCYVARLERCDIVMLQPAPP